MAGRMDAQTLRKMGAATMTLALKKTEALAPPAEPVPPLLVERGWGLRDGLAIPA